MAKLRRSDCNSPGITRRRAGKGFVYLDSEGQRIAERDVIERIKGLVIPPAWSEVWICPRENGHIQATGIDDAGRKQYLYHQKWSETRAARKFESMLDFAASLPKLRKAVRADLDPGEPARESVLACGVRLIDLGHFRVGGEQYASENETYGIATVKKEHVSLGRSKGEVVFDYTAKGSLQRTVTIRDQAVHGLSQVLLRRRSGPEDYLVYKAGKTWEDVTADDLNSYIKDRSGGDFSAKDFRTWSGTVLAAVALASDELPSNAKARDRRIKQSVEFVAGELGNTPAVARDSYIDPRLLDLFRSGQTIQRTNRSALDRRSLAGLSSVERQVRDLLAD